MNDRMSHTRNYQNMPAKGAIRIEITDGDLLEAEEAQQEVRRKGYSVETYTFCPLAQAAKRMWNRRTEAYTTHLVINPDSAYERVLLCSPVLRRAMAAWDVRGVWPTQRVFYLRPLSYA
jgi:hypothetical protein